MSAGAGDMPRIKICISDASQGARRRYRSLFVNHNTELMFFDSSKIEPEPLINFQPHLFIVDSLLRDGSEDGLSLVRELRKLLPETPVVVCSKYIRRDAPQDELLAAGVCAAYGKFPTYPSAATLLSHAHAISGGEDTSEDQLAKAPSPHKRCILVSLCAIVLELIPGFSLGIGKWCIVVPRALFGVIGLCMAVFSLAVVWSSAGHFFEFNQEPMSARFTRSRLKRLCLWLERHLLHPFGLSREVPGTRWEIYEDIVKSVPQLSRLVANLRQIAKEGKVDTRSETFDSYIKEMSWDFIAFLRQYRLVKTRAFMYELVATIVVVNLAFTALYMGTHTLTEGKGFVICPSRPSTPSLVEALYFSVVTFGTVGYGDIHPTTMAFSRIVVILEILTVFVVVGFGVNLGLTLFQTSPELEADELAETMRNDIESLTGGVA